MVDCCDLYVLLSKSKSIRNVGVYCRVLGTVGKPSALKDNVILESDGKFVEAEIFAVDLQGSGIKETYGIISESDRYLVNASMSVYVDANLVENDWYFFRGTLVVSSSSKIPLCTLMNTKKCGNNWILNKIKAQDFEISHFENTRRQSFYLSTSISNGRVTQPEDVLHFTRLYAEIPDSFVASEAQILKPTGLGGASLGYVPTIPEDKIVESVEYVSNETVMPVKSGKQKKENRTVIKEKPAVFDELQEYLKDSDKIKREYVESLKESYPLGDGVELVESLVNNIKRYWKSKPNAKGMTGKALLKGYISKSGEDVNQEYMGSSLLDYLLEIREELFCYMFDGTEITAEGEALEIAKVLFADADVFYAGVVSHFIGLSYDRAVELAKTLMKYGVSFAKVVETNPYILTICGLGVNFNTAESIAYNLGIWCEDSVSSSRNVAILSDYMIYGETQDTNYCVDDIKGATLGVKLTKNAYDKLKQGYSICSYNTQSNVSAYLKCSEVPYPKTNWVYSNGNYYLALSQNEKNIAIRDAEAVGLILRKTVLGRDMLFCTEFLKMELFILNKCYELSKRQSKYNDENRINFLINKYEEMKGFKLEPAQRQGVITSVKNCISAISGPAGSGKTTTSDCLVFVFNNWDVPDDEIGESESETDIRYAAPTGKAAKRLQEVVGSTVKTMHSEFKVGIGTSSILDLGDEEDDFVDCTTRIYIFDEVAMVPLRLFYTVLSRTGVSSIVLLGDICQLSPIGKGLPFRDLLKFIPCTFLLVSKRSLEGSGLTLNSNYINENSEKEDFKYLESTDDFKLVACPDDEIVNKIYTICGYHLGKVSRDRAEQICDVKMIETEEIRGVKPDDIQVMMPISTDRYTWGASVVNDRLQDLFNPRDGIKKEFKIQNFGKDKTIRVGDRVIHTNSNLYSMQWYESFDGKAFQMAWGWGIMNGDVGKVVDIVKADKKLKFLKPVGDPPEGYEEPKRTLRKDKSWRGDNHYFVVVEYYDYGSDKKYYILYQASVDGFAKGSGLFLSGEDLGYLDLSYALTTHKMQGSQNKLIIYGLGKVMRQGFVTRNAIYTAETRAGRGEYMVGSVHNSMTSQLNVARQIVEQEGVSTILGDIWDLC